MPKVSVVMAVHNCADELEETIRSVLVQDTEDFEFVIVDDGSSDCRVQNVLADFSSRDSRIAVISLQNNQGLTAALQVGCSAARGDYIARLDGGDVMMPNRLERQKEILERHPDCSFVSSWVELLGPKWEPLWINRGHPKAEQPLAAAAGDPEMGLAADIPHHGSVMFRKTAYRQAGGYRSEFYFGQDWDLWYRLAEIGTFYIVPEVLYRARVFPGGISSLHSRRQEVAAICSKGAYAARRRNQNEKLWLQVAAALHPMPNSDKAGRSRYEPGLYFIGEALRRRGDKRCREYLQRAVKAAPWRARSYIRWLQSHW